MTASTGRVPMVDTNDKSSRTGRRQFIQTVGSAGTVGLLAGCIGGGSSGQSGNGSSGQSGNGGSGQANLTAGAAPSGSTLYNTWQGILRAVNNTDTFVNLTTQETPGGEANIRLYDRGQIDIGGASLHDIRQALSGQGSFNNTPVDTLPLQAFRYAVMHLYIVAVDGSGIETTDDLRNDDVVVWPISPGTSVRAFTQYLFKQAGIWNELDVSDIASDAIAGAVEEGRVDAVVAYGAGREFLPGYYTQIDARTNVHSVALGSNLKSTIQDENAYLSLEPYGWQQNDLKETGAWRLNYQVSFGGQDSVSKRAGYELTKVITNSSDIIRSAQPAFPNSPEGMTKGIIADERLPVHPGVAQAYRELGVFDDSWTVGWNTDL